MLGHQTLRFIGGIWNGLFKEVAPSTNVVGTDMSAAALEVNPASPFKVGDEVEVVNNLIGPARPAAKGSRHIVKDVDFYAVYIFGTRAEGGRGDGYLACNFKLVPPAPAPKRPLKVGDRVRCVDCGGHQEYGGLKLGAEYTVTSGEEEGRYVWVSDCNAVKRGGYFPQRFELISEPTQTEPPRKPNEFRKGDIAELVEDYMSFKKGARFTVTAGEAEYDMCVGRNIVRGASSDEQTIAVYAKRLKLIPAPAPAPKPGVTQQYTRRRLVLSGPISKYEEVCMVLEGMSTVEAEKALVERIKPALDWSSTKKDAPIIPPARPETVKIPVRESSLIESVGYLEQGEILDVTFKDKSGNESGTYRYRNVSPIMLSRLLVAPSLGGFYCENIRNKFPCEKL